MVKILRNRFVLFAVLLVALGGIGYVWYVYLAPKDSSLNVLTTVGVPSATPAPEDKKVAEILAAIESLKSINLDTHFFEDEKFKALQDLPIDIPARQPVHMSLEQILQLGSPH